jgi:hypothetical protein
MFLGLDLHAWEHWMLVFLGVVGLGGVGVAAATYAVIKLQREEAATAKAELAENQANTAKEIAAANERAAGAQERAAKAQLELERLKAPRTLSAERQELVRDATAPFRGQKYRAAIASGADDGPNFWTSLYAALEQAGWTYIPNAGPGVGNPPAGIPIASIPGVEIRFDPTSYDRLAPAALALGNTLHRLGIVVAVSRERESYSDTSLRDVLFVVIGARVPPP